MLDGHRLVGGLARLAPPPLRVALALALAHLGAPVHACAVALVAAVAAVTHAVVDARRGNMRATAERQSRRAVKAPSLAAAAAAAATAASASRAGGGARLVRAVAAIAVVVVERSGRQRRLPPPTGRHASPRATAGQRALEGREPVGRHLARLRVGVALGVAVGVAVGSG